MNPGGRATSGISFRLALLTTFVTFCAFYAPQPLLPELATEFGVSATDIALLITVTFVFLSIAPLAYGLLIQRFSAQQLLVVATALLALLQFMFALSNSYESLLLSRILQGILYPAIFTAAVTYCSMAGQRTASIERVSLYVATTILGGMGGRLMGGFVSSYFNWQVTFYILGIALLLCSATMTFALRDSSFDRDEDAPVDANPGKESRGSLPELLSRPYVQSALALIFTTFFTFSAILNALPFRLRELDPSISNARISLVYIGYLVGIVIAANARRIGKYAGGTVIALGIALLLYLCSLCLLLTTNTWFIVAVGFLSSSTFFLIHSTLTGHISDTPNAPGGMVNGLYISCYYLAGASGSILPLWIYKAQGWTIFLLALGIIAALGFVALRWMKILERHN